MARPCFFWAQDSMLIIQNRLRIRSRARGDFRPDQTRDTVQVSLQMRRAGRNLRFHIIWVWFGIRVLLLVFVLDAIHSHCTVPNAGSRYEHGDLRGSQDIDRTKVHTPTCVRFQPFTSVKGFLLASSPSSSGNWALRTNNSSERPVPR